MVLGLLAVNAKYIHSNLPLRYLRQRFCEPSQFLFFEYTINQEVQEAYQDILQAELTHIFVSLYIWNAEWVHKLMSDVKRINPALKVYVGGPEAEYHTSLLKSYPWVDVSLIGNIDALVSQSQLDAVLVANQLGYALEPSSIEHLPFPYTVKELEDLAMVYYESERGCPFSCSFCVASTQNKRQQKSLEIVFAEIQRFLDSNVGQVKFVDRTFNASQERAMAIVEYIIHHHNQVTNFHFELAPHLITADFVRAIAQSSAGTFQFEIGIQSFNEVTLSAIERNPNQVKQLEGMQALIETKKAHIHLDLIGGLPYETLESFKSGFNQLLLYKPHMIQLGFLKLLMGTKLYCEQSYYNYKVREYAPYEVLSSHTMDATDIIVLKGIEACVETFYNSHRYENTLSRILLVYEGDGFCMFRDLRAYLVTSSPAGLHSSMTDYELLYQFALSKTDSPQLTKDLLLLDYLTHYAKPTEFYKPVSAKLDDAVHERLRDIQVQRQLIGDSLMEAIPVKELLKKGQLVDMETDLKAYGLSGDVIYKPGRYFVLKHQNRKHDLPKYAFVQV